MTLTPQQAAQFPDIEETLERTGDIPRTGDEPTGAFRVTITLGDQPAAPAAEPRPQGQEPPAWAVFLFQAACWILAVGFFLLLFAGIRALWTGFNPGA